MTRLQDYMIGEKQPIIAELWVLFLLSAQTRPIYPTHFAGNPYTARIMATSTPM